MLTETLTTTETLTATEVAVVGGVLGSVAIFAIVFYVLLVIAGWRIMKKAGEPGWKILIPIYNLYMMMKIVGMQNWFWISLIAEAVVMIVNAASGYSGQADFDFGAYPLVMICAVLQGIWIVVVNVVYAWRTSKVFGHGVGYAIGLFFLPNIFWLILGFGKSKYSKKMLKK